MNTDELKSTWQAIEQRLERENELSWQRLRAQRLGKVDRSLRPLFWGQCLQMGFGICMILLAVMLWDSPWVGAVTLGAGVVVHVYGVVCIIAAGVVLSKLRTLDYAKPVVTIQLQLAQVRRYYVISGMVAGLPWWFMWIAVIIVLAGLVGVDFYAESPLTVWSGGLVGVAGLAGTAVFHCWSRSEKRPRLAQYMNDAVTGQSLYRAQSQLDELRRFETD